MQKKIQVQKTPAPLEQNCVVVTTRLMGCSMADRLDGDPDVTSLRKTSVITIGEKIFDSYELAVEPMPVKQIVRPSGSFFVETLHVDCAVLGLAVDGNVDHWDAFAAAEECVLDLQRPIVT